MFKRTSYLLVILGFLGLLVGLLVSVPFIPKNMITEKSLFYLHPKELKTVAFASKSTMAEVVVEDMVYIPAGEFIMGSPSGEGDSNEYPPHKVYLDAFYIDKYEVTNEDYCRFLNEKGNQEEEGVLWLDIDSWICPIEKRDGKHQAKSGYEKHLVGG